MLLQLNVCCPSMDDILQEWGSPDKIPCELEIEVGVINHETDFERTSWRTLGTLIVPFELIEKSDSASLACEPYDGLLNYLWQNLKNIKWN